MKLKFIKDYKSIESFNDVLIADFSFFTGRNGSGKTHLLKAIKEGSISVENFSSKEILYFNYGDFEFNFQRETNDNSRNDAWNRVKNKEGSDVVLKIKNLESNLNSFIEVIESTAISRGVSIFKLQEKDFLENGNVIINKINEYNIAILDILNENNQLGDEVLQSIYFSVICKSNVFLSSINEREFKNLFQKVAIGNRKILSDLSTVFLEYFRNMYRNKKSAEELSVLEFEKNFGPAPWKLIRNIFLNFGLNFDVNDPQEEDLDPITGSFKIKFKNIDRGKEVPFDDLSSGERILITLVNALYTVNNNEGLPKLILLDEVDGPLNPSIIESFISYIEESFVDNNVKVIIATHSPTTIAFAPEDSVYSIDTSKKNPIVQVGNREGIKILTEGFIVLSDLLEFSQIQENKIIISEGANYKYLEKAKEIFYNNNDLAIFQIKQMSDFQLRTLFDFLRRFTNNKEIIFVWDCDYRYKDKDLVVKRDLNDLKNKSSVNNRVFIFEERSDGIVKRGIENLIKNDINLDTYNGGLTEYEPNNKKVFAKYVLGQEKLEDVLKNFFSLFEFIKGSDFHNL